MEHFARRRVRCPGRCEMKRRPIVAGCLGLAAIIAGLFIFGALRNQAVPVGVVDPAIEFYTKGHGGGFAAIDRWAHYGMPADRFVAVLQKAGYICQPPEILKDATEAGAMREVPCHKTEQWPIGRTLAIHAGIEPGIVGRLATVHATSTLVHDSWFLAKPWGNLLRKFNLIEPETLQVTGFQIESIDTLSRMVADALSLNGWGARCTDEKLVAQCQEMASDRIKSGFPALLQAPLAAGTALEIHRAMERIRFAPIQKRGNDSRPEDSLLVRLTDGRMWLDFTSKDLSGHKLTASIELESKGGTPTSLVTGLDGESRTMRMAGSPRLANDRSVIYLLPEGAIQDTRYSVWLDLPNRNFPGTFDKLTRSLPLVDPAFIAPMIKAIIGDLQANTQPEESLGLYPALRQIEKMADVIRALRPDRLLPPETGNRLIAQTYADDPAIRAAWAFAVCVSTGTPASIDGNCLLRFTAADPDAAALVRSEIAKLQLLYADLPETHPLRIRLKRLDEAFLTEHQGNIHVAD